MTTQPAVIGYHCSHEQYAPSALLALVREAEQAGFRAAMSSDHFSPFSNAQGHSGFAWTWLGAALQATKLPFGVVNAPGQRYHPAIVAQAAATVCELFPDRFWMALGTGQFVSEHITGDPWPAKPVRRARLKEAVDVIRALFRGETVTHDGLVRVREAKLYSRPARPPMIVGAAVSAETAEWVGSWADALITIGQPHESQAKVVEAFRRGGGAGKPMFLQVALSWAKSEEEALRVAHEQWRTNVIPSGAFVTDTMLPDHFDAAASFVRLEDMRGPVRVSADLGRQADWLHGDVEMGFEQIHLHHVGFEQRPFIGAFAERVLPAFSPRA